MKSEGIENMEGTVKFFDHERNYGFVTIYGPRGWFFVQGSAISGEEGRSCRVLARRSARGLAV